MYKTNRACVTSCPNLLFPESYAVLDNRQSCADTRNKYQCYPTPTTPLPSYLLVHYDSADTVHLYEYYEAPNDDTNLRAKRNLKFFTTSVKFEMLAEYFVTGELVSDTSISEMLNPIQLFF